MTLSDYTDDPRLARIFQELDRRMGALETLPVYDTTNLPMGSPDGTRAIVDMPGGFRSMIVKNNAIGGASSWVVLTPHPINGSGSPASFTSTAVAQWNKPSPTRSVTLPFAGSYRFEAQAEMVSGVAQSIIGIGAAPSTFADTASPTLIGTSGEDVANFRSQVNLNPDRVAGAAAGDVWDLRFFMQSIATMQFARASFWAWPVYITGVV